MKDGINKKIKKDELEKYLLNGWLKGAKLNLGKTYDINKEGISKRIKEIDLPKFLENGWIIGKNACWISDGNINKQIKKEELEKYLLEGWFKGTKNGHFK